MTDLRGEEKVAAATIAATLNCRVEQHDDGSRPSMHDLNIVAVGSATAAVEVTAAADADSIALWKLVNARDERLTYPDLAGGWMLQLKPNTRAKTLLGALPALLEELEATGVRQIPRQRHRMEHPESIEGRAHSLGVVAANQSGTDFPGSIYFTIELPHERSGGVVDSAGATVPGWVRDFLLDPHQDDVLSKLANSGAAERHAFILIPGLSTAPFSVTDMLRRGVGDAVPSKSPQLPDEVTHVWLMSGWAQGSGLRWSPGQRWQRFKHHLDANG